jgi:hypothetical protein
MTEMKSTLRRFCQAETHRFKQAIVARIPMRMAESLAALDTAFRSMLNAEKYASVTIREELGIDLLQLKGPQARSCRFSQALESFIDQRIYFGRAVTPTETWPDLDAVADALLVRIAELRAQDAERPIFISPFHYVSQYANIYVVDKLAERMGLDSLAVVSGVPSNTYGDDHALVRRLNILYTYGDANRGGLGVRLSRSLRQNRIAVLFADVPPFTMHRYPMETSQVTMFGRDARIHHGVFRIGAKSDAWLVPFYLNFARGRFGVHLFDTIALSEKSAPQTLANCIESALRDNYHRWLPAGHPAMYSFAPSR